MGDSWIIFSPDVNSALLEAIPLIVGSEEVLAVFGFGGHNPIEIESGITGVEGVFILFLLFSPLLFPLNKFLNILQVRRIF